MHARPVAGSPRPLWCGHTERGDRSTGLPSGARPPSFSAVAAVARKVSNPDADSTKTFSIKGSHQQGRPR